MVLELSHGRCSLGRVACRRFCPSKGSRHTVLLEHFRGWEVFLSSSKAHEWCLLHEPAVWAEREGLLIFTANCPWQGVEGKLVPSPKEPVDQSSVTPLASRGSRYLLPFCYRQRVCLRHVLVTGQHGPVVLYGFAVVGQPRK